MRAAAHVGTADERDGDYFGPTVNRAARLLAIGHGGQVLLSGACAELIQAELPPDCSLRDLGAHRLKDLTQPERVYSRPICTNAARIARSHASASSVSEN